MFKLNPMNPTQWRDQRRCPSHPNNIRDATSGTACSPLPQHDGEINAVDMTVIVEVTKNAKVGTLDTQVTRAFNHAARSALGERRRLPVARSHGEGADAGGAARQRHSGHRDLSRSRRKFSTLELHPRETLC